MNTSPLFDANKKPKALKLPQIDDNNTSVYQPKQLSHLPDFIIDSLCQSLQMQPAQATALLAGNQKFLVYLCVKGMTGKDYSKLVTWFHFLYNQVAMVVQLFMIEQDNPKNIIRTLNIFKCGLFSHNLEVFVECSRMICKLWDEIRDLQQYGLQQTMYDWFTHRDDQNQQISGQFTNRQIDVYFEWLRIPKSPKELETMVKEPGIISYMRAWWLFQHKSVDEVAQALTRFGEVNQMEVYTVFLRRYFQNTHHYLMCISDLFNYLHQDISNLHLQMQANVINSVVQLCVHLSKDNFTATVDEKIMALSLLVDIYHREPDTINLDNTLQDQILQILKQNARDPQSSVLRVSSVHFLFMLLLVLANDKNRQAPIIYKALTFMLIEFYNNNELREEMLKNFWQLFLVNQQIPVAILLEPMIEQIKVNLKKQQQLVDNSSLQATQINPTNLSINVTELDFFLSLAGHPRLSAPIAISLLEIACIIAREQILFTRVSLKLALTILGRFQGNLLFQEKVIEIINENLEIIVAQDQEKAKLFQFIAQNQSKAKRRQSDSPKKAPLKKKSLAPTSLKLEQQAFGVPQTDIVNYPVLDDKIVFGVMDPQFFPDEADKYYKMKMNEKMIVNLMQCLIHSGHQAISDYILERVIKTYTQLEARHKFKNKGLFYLMSLFDKDVFGLLKKRQHKEIQVVRKRTRNASQEINGNPNVESKLMKQQSVSSAEDQIKSSVSTKQDFVKKPTQSTKDDFSREMSPVERYGGKMDTHDRTQQSYSLRRRNKLSIDTKNPNNNENPMKSIDSQLDKIKIKKKDNSIRRKQYVEQQLPKYELFEISSTGEAGEKAYVESVTTRLKLYKTIFEIYAKLSQINKDTLPDQQHMHLQEIFIFLRDFKFSMHDQRGRDQIKSIVKQINNKVRPDPDEKQAVRYDLNLVGFIEFMLQLGHMQYSHFSSDPIEFMTHLFTHLHQNNQQNPQINRLFMQADQLKEKKFIKELNLKLKQDSHFQLPAGYSKEMITMPPSEAMFAAYDVVNQILLNKFGFKYPLPTNKIIWKAKKDVRRDTQNTRGEGSDNLQYSTPAGSQKMGPDHQRLKGTKRQGNVSEGSDSGVSQLNKILTRHAEKQTRNIQDDQPLDANSSIKKLIQISEKKNLFQRQTYARKKSLPGLGNPADEYDIPPSKSVQLKRSIDNYGQNLRSIESIKTSQRHGSLVGRRHLPASLVKSPQSLKPLNKVQSNKLIQHQEELKKRRQDDDARRKRQESLKKQLKNYQQVRVQKEKEIFDKLQAKLEEDRHLERVQNQKKKQYYQKIKSLYDQDRLPEIVLQRQQVEEQKQRDQEEKKQKSKQASKNIKQQAEALSAQFQETIERQRLGLQEKEQKELAQKMREDKIRSKIKAKSKYMESITSPNKNTLTTNPSVEKINQNMDYNQDSLQNSKRAQN